MSDYQVVELGSMGPWEAVDLGGTPVVATTPVVAGPPGASAYELAVAQGFTGTLAQWLASLKGADGDDGAGAVASVNGETGTVVLSAGDVGAETPAGAQAKVDAAVGQLLGGAPAAALDTIKELGDLLGSQGSALGAVTTALAGKADMAALKPVALSGAYADLTGKPVIPSTPAAVGADPAGTAAAVVEAHRVDTADVHGILDTAALETQAGAQAKADAALAAATTAATTAATSAAEASTAAAIAAHAADSTAVHGIADTTLLLRGTVGSTDPAGPDPQDPGYGAGLPVGFLWCHVQ